MLKEKKTVREKRSKRIEQRGENIKRREKEERRRERGKRGDGTEKRDGEIERGESSERERGEEVEGEKKRRCRELGERPGMEPDTLFTTRRPRHGPERLSKGPTRKIQT